MSSLSETVPGKMRFGVVSPHCSYFSSYLRSPDLVTRAILIDLPNIQTTLAEAHVVGSGVFRFTSSVFPEGQRHFENVATGSKAIRLHDPATGALTQVNICKTGGSPYAYVVGGPGFTGDQSWPAGTIVDAVLEVDGFRNDSTNPADWPISELVVDGIPTGYPNGLRTGQTLGTLANSSNEVRLPAGNYVVQAHGTGTVRVDVNYADRPDLNNSSTITITGGVASGPAVFNTDQASYVRINLMGSSPSDPLWGVRVISPGTWPADGSAYAGLSFAAIYEANKNNREFYLPHPDYITIGRPFRHNRLVDSHNVILTSDNTTARVTVDDLPSPYQRLGNIGMIPFEWTIEECNLAGQDSWLNVQDSWSNAVIDRFVTLWKARAKPELKLRVAHECEVWNTIFAAWVMMVVKGSATFNPRVCQALELVGSGPYAGQVRVTKPGHGFTSGQTVQVASVGDLAYRGAFPITVEDADHFRYTPSATPTASPAPPSWIGPPIAFRPSDPRTYQVSDVRWISNDTESYLQVTTTTPHGCDGNTVAHLCNVATAGVDGTYRLSPVSATVLRIDYGSQRLHAPLLPATSNRNTVFSAVAGQAILLAVVGTVGAVAGTSIDINQSIGRMHGRRTADIWKRVSSAFPNEEGRLGLQVEVWCEGTDGFNKDTCQQLLADLGGNLPAVASTELLIATYLEPDPLDRAAAFVGDYRSLLSVVVSGGVATATCANNRPLDPLNDPYGPATNAVGWTSGDSIHLFNTTDPKAVGVWGPITVADSNAATFTFPMSGIADGPLFPARSALFCIRGTPKGAEITGFSRSGTAITYTTPCHPFAVGQTVGFGSFATRAHNQPATITAATANSITINLPDINYDPGLPAGARAWCFDQAMASIPAKARLAMITNPVWASRLTRIVAEAGKWGMIPGTYETGTDSFAPPYLQPVGWLDAVNIADRDVPETAAYFAAAEQAHLAAGVGVYTFYCLCSWGNYGLRRVPSETTIGWDTLLSRMTGDAAPRQTNAAATRFAIDSPGATPVGLVGRPGRLGPVGVLSVDTTVTLTDGGAGGSFTPSTLQFKAGTRSAQAYSYTSTSIGSHDITGTLAPALGPKLLTEAVALDPNGNPGNATVIFQDNFDRADGSVGSNWVVDPVGSLLVKGNALASNPDNQNYLGRAAMTPIRDIQVEATYKLADGATYGGNGCWDLHLRTSGTGDNTAYTARFAPNSYNGIFWYLRDKVGNETLFSKTDLLAPWDKSAPLRVLFKCFGTPGRMVGSMVDTGSNVTVASWDFPVPATQFGTSNPITQITSPGVLALGYLNGQDVDRFDDIKVSRLDFATGFTMSGPASINAGSSGDFSVTPVGGPTIADTTVTLSDGGAGGSFNPPTLVFPYNNPTPQVFTYTAPTQSGNVTLSSTTNPALSSPSQVVVQIGGSSSQATGYALSLGGTATVGTPVTVTATLTGGAPLATPLVVTLSCPGASFGGSLTIPAGSTSGSTQATPTSAGSFSITASHSGSATITDPSPLAVTFNAATKQPATGYAVILPATVTVGQSVPAVVVLTGGTDLAGSLKVTLTDPNGSFTAPLTITVGQNYATTTYTANSAGTHTITAQHTGGNSSMTDPASVSLSASNPADTSTGSGLTAAQVQAACAAAIQATPVTVSDKTGFSLTATERSAIGSGVDAALVASHGSGSWASVDPLATVVAGRYGAGTAGSLIGAIASIDAISAAIAATPVGLKAGAISSTTYASGAPLTSTQIQAACVAAITATPVTVTKNNDKSGYALASGGLDIVLVEGTINARQAMSVMLATSAGIISGSGTGVITIKAANATTTRVVASTDNSGNRSSIQLTLPS